MYTLNLSAWHGSESSKDILMPQTHESKVDALESLEQYKKWWARSGYILYCCSLTHPDGTVEQLGENTCKNWTII